MMFPMTKRVDNVIDQIVAMENFDPSSVKALPAKDAMDQIMKTLLRKKTMSLITSPERRASFLRKID